MPLFASFSKQVSRGFKISRGLSVGVANGCPKPQTLFGYRSFGTYSKQRFMNIDWRLHGIKFLFFSVAATVESYFLYSRVEDEIKCDSPSLILVHEVKKHNKADDCWISIDGNVYDVTKFLELHPGGISRILLVAGGDASKSFFQMHSQETLEKMLPYLVYLGALQGKFEEEITADEATILGNVSNKPSLGEIFNLSDFEYVAKKVLPKSTYFYYATGSSDEFSLRENHYAYSRVYFRPKVLQETSTTIDTSSSLMGTKVDLPIYITAFAGSKFAHPLGEKVLQQAAYKSNIMQMVPMLMSYSLDEFFQSVPEDQNQWYQLHFDTYKELANLENRIKEIEKYKTVKAIFINVDLADLGNREKDSKRRAEDEASAALLATAANNGKTDYPSNLSWKHIERIRACTNIPIALKGIQRGEDVVLAAEKGTSGVVLSNHGGRQLDFSRPPLEVLSEAKQMLKERGLDNKIEIYIDGGIRRGSDIVKALCLGATGVGLGRPFLYAMAGYGEEGVLKLVLLLEGEVKNNMKLLGVDNIKDLNEELIDTTTLKFRGSMVNDRLYDGVYEQLNFPSFKNEVGSIN